MKKEIKVTDLKPEPVVNTFKRLNGVLIGREFRRLSFLVERDGIVKAKEFAKRGIKQYRKYILSKEGYPFRRKVIESYLDFKKLGL